MAYQIPYEAYDQPKQPPRVHLSRESSYTSIQKEKKLNRVQSRSTQSLISTKSERAQHSPLSRMLASGEVSNEEPRDLTVLEKLDRYMVNEGGRKLLVSIFVLLHGMVFAFGFTHYYFKDTLASARATFGLGYPIARAAALVLHFDVALILFPVCRTLVSLLRQTPLNGIIPFDKNISFHKVVGYAIVAFTVVHVGGHWYNFAVLAMNTKTGFVGWLRLNFQTLTSITGYVMLIALIAMTWTAIEKPRRANYDRFWTVHHLFIVFFIFWSIHGAFCMIREDIPNYCSNANISVFWKWWMYGGLAYLCERVMREVRGRHQTVVSKVIQHPSNVVEIQIQKERTKVKPGQYVFLCCPEVSIWQYHPFTLTSAPEEDFISVHIRMVGDFTKTLGLVLGCEDPRSRSLHPERAEVPHELTTTMPGGIQRILPQVCIDGPFGSASEDVFKFETAVLVGAGIGVTPFASILKSIWFRMSSASTAKTRLKKVYFFWICREFGSLEWFRDLLMAIESQDVTHSIEIHTYLTANISAADANNIMLNSNDTDAITGLRTPTNFGRPNWDMIFRAVRKLHSPGEAGVFFCGPKSLGSLLHVKCNMYSEGQRGFQFVWGKENF